MKGFYLKMIHHSFHQLFTEGRVGFKWAANWMEVKYGTEILKKYQKYIHEDIEQFPSIDLICILTNIGNNYQLQIFVLHNRYLHKNVVYCLWYVCWYGLGYVHSWHTKVLAWRRWRGVSDNSYATSRDIYTLIVFL